MFSKLRPERVNILYCVKPPRLPRPLTCPLYVHVTTRTPDRVESDQISAGILKDESCALTSRRPLFSQDPRASAFFYPTGVPRS